MGIGAVIQLLLLAASHWDLSRRASTEVRGAKGMWRVVTLINFIGPLMYFTFGRRKG